MLLAGILAAAVLSAVLATIPLLSGRKDSEDATPCIDIPEADIPETEEGKADSYSRGGGIADYWDSLEELEDAPGPEKQDPDDLPSVTEPPGRRPGATGVDDLFGDCRDAPKAYAEPPTPKPVSATVAEPDIVPETKPTDEEAPRPPVKRSGAVSSLDEDVAADLGSGFSTLDGNDRWVESRAGKPYRCMFTRDEKVRSGQRVTVRLLEDLVVDGVHVPRNTHLQGVAEVGDRLEVAVSSLDVGGKIVPLRFEAYDTDGCRGIYCPEPGQAGKAVTEQGLSTASSTLNSRLGRIARDAASAGAGIVRGKAGEAAVSVPAGYTFYIIEKTD